MALTDSEIQAKLLEARVSFNFAFQTALRIATPALSKEFTTETISTSETTKYPLLGRMSGLREWIGPRVFEDLSRHVYELPNRKFEKSFEVPIDKLEDEQFDGYVGIAEEFGYQASMWSDDLVVEAIQQGNRRVCFDGQFFFDTDHPTDPGNPSSPVYSNLFTGKPLTSANLTAVLTSMQTIVGRDKRPIGFGRNGGVTLVVPPQLREVASQILAAEYLANGATNVNRSVARPLVWDRLFDPSDPVSAARWFVMDTSQRIKPFLFQNRKRPSELVAKTSETDDAVFHRDVFQWGVKARGAAGYTLPFLAARVDP